MRRLVLIRHAKAEQDGASDVERALAPRGLRDAAAIGTWLAAHDIAPDHVVISPSRRTRQTWALIAAELAPAPEPAVDPRIYDNNVDELIAIIHATPATALTVALVGHNPSMHAAAYAIDDGEGDPDARQWLRSEFPTSALAVFEIAGQWADVGPATGRLIAAAAPRG